MSHSLPSPGSRIPAAAPRPSRPAGSRILPSAADRWAALAVAVGVLAFFAVLELAKPNYFLWDDNASFFLPCYVHDYESLVEHGELAQVNPHQYLGYTYLASGQTGVLYPPVYLAMAASSVGGGDLRHGIDLLVIGHLLVAAWGLLALLRRFGVGRTTAVLASLWWTTLPFYVLASRNWVFVAYAAAFLPWSLWLLDRLLARPGAGRALALALVKALFFFQGYVQYFVMASLFEGIFALGRIVGGARSGSAEIADAEAGSRARTSRGRQLVALFGAAAASAVFAAPLLLPMLRAKSVSAYRAGSLSFEEFLSNALDPAVVLGAQWFAMEERAIHLASGALFYFGLPALVGLAALGTGRLAIGRERAASEEASSASAPDSAADETSARGTPPVAIDPSARKSLDWPAVALALGVAVLALLASTRLFGLAYEVPVLSSFRWPFKYFAFFLFYLSIAVAGGFSTWERGPRPWLRRAGWGVLVAGILGHLLIALHPQWSRPFGPNRVDRPVEEIRADVARSLVRGTGDAGVAGRVVSLWLSPLEPQVYRLLIFQYATLADAHHLGGYDPLIARENLDLAVNLEYSNIFRYELGQESLDYLSSWSVRFLLVPRRPAFPEIFGRFPQLRRVYQDARMEVWENARALPLAYFLGRPGQPARPVDPAKVHFGPRGVRIDTAGESGLLRLQVAPLDGYEVRMGGQVVGPPRVDAERHVLVDVPAGVDSVELRYVDLPLRIGVALASVSLLAALGLGLVARRRARPHSRPHSRHLGSSP